MNKSKFLKKSLAMLLALMLVLAMIPLSASAAQTDYINYLTVNGKNAAIDGDGYSVTVGTPKVTLTASLSDNVRLLYVDDQGEKKTIPANGKLVDLSDGYSAGVEDEYELTIIAMAKENPDVSDEETEYTYNVTVKVSTAADSTNTALEGLADGNETWPNMVDWSVDNEANVVNVLFKFGANHPKMGSGTADDPKLDPTDFAAKDPTATVTVVKNDEITVTAQNNSSETYKLVFTNEPAFESFTIPKQTGETEFTYGSGDHNFIDIDVPYAYDYTNVVPTFELVEKFAGKDLVGKGADKYTFISSVTAIPYAAEIAEDPMTTEYEANGKVSYWQYVFEINTGETGIGVKDITLRIHPVQLNPAGDLLTVKVTDSKGNKSNTTEINVTGTNNIEMPNGSLTKGPGFRVELTFSQDATVYVYDKAGEREVTSVDGKSAAVTLDLGEGTSFNVKVVSEDGKVTKNYQINLNPASVAEAKLDSVIFKDLTTGKLYEADITEDGDEKGTVVLTVPYSWRDVSTLSNAVAYINASTGAVVKLTAPATSTWDEDWNGKTDGTANGTSLDKIIGSKTWFPFPGEEDATSTIQVTNTVGGVGGTKFVTRTYTVKVKTETAKGGRTIESLNFSSEDNVKEITADNTFSAKVGTAKLDDGSATGKTVNTIEVTVPYSWPKPKSEDGTMYLYQLAMDDGAKLYAHDGRSWSAETGVDALGQLTFDLAVKGKFDAVTDGEIDPDKAIPVRVLSEANSVDFSATDKKNEITDALGNSKLYTEYYIYCVKAPAETGAELLSIESVDENVTVTLKDRIITVNVPNSYPTKPVYTTNPETFALKFTTSKQAKVYETYNKAANTVDNQLVSEKSLFGVYDQNDELYVVKATSTNTNGNIQLTGDPIKDGEPAESKVGAIYVRSEDGKTTNAYTVKLVINKVETGADVTALSVNGTAATIARDQINVRLPLGTKLYPVTLDIDASKMADVYVSPVSETNPVQTKYAYDPEARYDVNRPLKITVVAEDKKTSKIYTLTATVADSFNDVPTSEWYYDEVMTAANAGWINGTKPGYFEPNGTMTRGDFAVIIARILGCDTEATVESKFPDCNETDYFNAAVTFCKLRGIIDGDDKGYFNPYDAITREEMAKILCNALELDELETSANPFEDDAEIAQWAKGYVNAVQAEGIMEGSNGSFNPRDNATRAEGAAVLVRAFANA